MTDEERWKQTGSNAKISISENFKGVKNLYLPAHSFLRGSDAMAEDLEVIFPDNVPAFFLVNGVPDYLACSFYHLSRYEEYLSFSADAHGRFPAAESHAQKYGYLHRPVVREWAALLGRKLLAVFPELPPAKVHPWRFRPSYDIDALWAWQYRGERGVASGLRDVLTGHHKRAWQRLTVSAENDPFNSLAFLQSLHQPPGPDQSTLNPVWFWLLADNAHRKDTNPFPTPDVQKTIMSELGSSDTIGIHPGYRASDDPSLLRDEIDRLAAITGTAVRHSRQHFLRFRLPGTYRELRNAGITHDYTMGYADDVGWRAGTNLSFFWYDLEREEATGLMVHPFVAMDVTLNNYLKLNPEAATQCIIDLANAVRPFGGDFMLLWHNSSFAEAYGWAGWKEAYVEIVEELRR